MSNTIDYVPFCPTDTGTNLEEQASYLADPDLAIGNQPGVARLQLVNKALRQATAVASAVANAASNLTNTSVLDNANQTALIAQLTAAFCTLAPLTTAITATGAGTYNLRYVFFASSCNATVNATYTNNGVTYTVIATVAAGTQVIMSGSSAPTTSGTLTFVSGTGDATITFFAVRAPISLEVQAVGGGGGGQGNSGATSGASAGGTTTFGGQISCTGGGFSATVNNGGAGGTGTQGTYLGYGLPGSAGCNSGGGTNSNGHGGPAGGDSFFGGGGSGGGNSQLAGQAAATNSGSGGGGGVSSATSSNGGSGGAGGYAFGLVLNPTGNYAYSVGTAGAGATAGGGAGAAGIIIIVARY